MIPWNQLYHSNMIRSVFPFLLIFLLATAGFVSAQPQQPDSEELEKRNGFKNIKLNTSIDSVKGAVFKEDILEKGGYPAKLYSVTGEDYKTIGEVRIESIKLKTYKDLVYEITVITEKDPNLMKGMTKALGTPSFSIRTNLYSWRSKSVVLTFESVGKNDLKLNYKSYPVFRRMAEDKGRKAEDVVSDF